MNSRPRRVNPGMKICLKCGVCPYIKEGKSVNATSTGYKVDINIKYLLGCKKCPQRYIGETERMLKERFSEHRGYVNTKNLSKTTGAHFNKKGHSISDMEITIIEKLFTEDPQFRKQREKMYIQKFNTRHRGLNKMNGG